jgi:hypothetical protein
MDFYYNGAWRMDWGFGNPNKTAALIACLMVGLWAFALLWRRAFWPVLVAFTVLAWCLVQTYSRGGMVAFLGGTAVLLLFTPRPWPKSRWLAILVATWVVGGFVLYAKAEARYGQGLFSEDQSIRSRLVIWRHVPEMMAAAPWGWGWGRAGDAYTQWFQPPAQSMNYLNLVSSHFTWMVEGGWLVSALYLSGLCGILLLCRPLPESRLRAVPLAVWVTFLVSGCFSHVAESPWLWILPVLLLGYVLAERFRLAQWPRLVSVGGIGLASVGVVALLIMVGITHASLPIRFVNGATIIGNGPDATLILVDRGVMGKLYGHTLRRFLAGDRERLAEGSFVVSESATRAVPQKLHQVILSGHFVHDGKTIAALDGATRIVLVNPDCFPAEVMMDPGMAFKTFVYFGEYSQSPSRSTWASYPGVKAQLIAGAGDFVPAWPEAILESPRT